MATTYTLTIDTKAAENIGLLEEFADDLGFAVDYASDRLVCTFSATAAQVGELRAFLDAGEGPFGPTPAWDYTLVYG